MILKKVPLFALKVSSLLNTGPKLELIIGHYVSSCRRSLNNLAFYINMFLYLTYVDTILLSMRWQKYIAQQRSPSTRIFQRR